jgi:hypothetical protein
METGSLSKMASWTSLLNDVNKSARALHYLVVASTVILCPTGLDGFLNCLTVYED